MIIILFYSFIIYSKETTAQVSVKGIPESFNLNLKKAIIIPVLQLDSVHVQSMLEEDNKFRIDNRYGVIQTCSVNIKEEGVKIEIPGKGTIWQYQVESKDAFSLGIFFKRFYLPKGASVFIYNTSKSLLRGAFTQQNNNTGHRLPVAEFQGKNLIIEYFEPLSADFSGELELGSVSQSYVNFQSVASTRIGINCSQGSNWQEVKHCVCLMTFNDTYYSYFCTGELMNNTRKDETPYFLTANHCINSEIVAHTLVTYFNYENSTCTSNDASQFQSLSGATLKSENSFSDFSLLLLNEYPGIDYNPFYAGWNASGSNPNSGVCIHHPDGTAKCIAIDTNPIISYDSVTQWTDGNSNQTTTTSANTHWMVEFNQGNTEVGSSGSPLFDENKHVVGQLHGGSDAMSLYGKFSLSWNYSSLTNRQLKHWLDPDNTGKIILDGIRQKAPQSNFIAEIQEVCLNTPILFTDESEDNPTAWLWKIQPSSYSFANGTDSTSENPQIMFLKEGIYSISLNASNKYGSNTMTQANYIMATSKINVRFLQAGTDSVVCGCDLNSFPLIAYGALNYEFNVSEKALIDTKISSDTLFLSLNKSAIGGKSFNTWVKVVGTTGTCTSSDSILFHVIVQPNDNVANAAKLSLGRNTGYSNHCASVESNEPYPPSSGCLVSNNWCPDQTNSGSVLNNSIWFTFTAPSNGLLTINTSGFDDQIAIYSASSPGSILSGNSIQYKILAANDNRSATDNTAQIVDLTLDPGKQYWLQLDGNNAAYGDAVIDLISNSIEVYPNPSTGIFYLIISTPTTEIADVAVYDLQGRKLLEKQYTTSLTSDKFSLDLSGYAKGMYLIDVKINGSNLSKKVIRR